MSPTCEVVEAHPSQAGLSGNGTRDKDSLPCLLTLLPCPMVPVPAIPVPGPRTRPCSPRGAHFPTITPIVPAPVLATSQALGRMGMVMLMESIPRVPHWRGRRVVREVKSLPVKLARCLPPPAVLCLLCTGMAVPAQSISEGAGCLWEGAEGAAVPISPCTQAGKCRQDAGVAGMCSLGTHGERISPAARWVVPGRSRQGGEGDGSSQGISGCQALPESCGITGDVRVAWLRAAGGAESE